MEFHVLLAVLLCLLAGVVLYTRRAHAHANTYHIGDPAVAHRALVENADDFLSRPAASFPGSLATWRDGERNDNIATVKYGPLWRALRANLTAEITSRLGSLAPLREEAAQALVADFSARCAGGSRDLAVREPIAEAVFALATRLCFGDFVDDGHRSAMGRVIKESIAVAGKLTTSFGGSMLSRIANGRRFRRIYTLLDRQVELYLPLIAARRQSQSQLRGGNGTVRPYVDTLLDFRVPDDDDNATAGRPLRRGELVALVFEFLGAATGSTATCLNAVVLETLRMHPPVPFILRSAHGEGAKEIGGVTSPVPADGLKVLFNLGDMGRDGKTWTDPDKFRPERFLAGGEAEDVGPAPGPKEIRMMPFGAGHRNCPAMSMAMLHVKCFLAAIVHEFDFAPSAEDGSGGVDMTEQPDGFVKLMKKPLSALVTRRT